VRDQAQDLTGANFEELLSGDTGDTQRVRISFREFISAYRRHLKLLVKVLAVVLPVTFVATVLGLHLFSSQTYTAAMTVAPNRLVSAGNEGNAGGGLSSLIGLQGLTDTQFDLYLTTRNSNLLAAKLMSIPGVPQKIFESLWDKEKRQWRAPPGVWPSLKRGVSRSLGFTPWSPPNSGDVAEFLKKSVTVGTDKRTLITRIEFSDHDRDFSKFLLLTVHSQAESLLREQAQRRTRIMIAHLIHELATVTVTEQREALIQLLSQQEKQMMMIDDNLPYAAVVIDPPSVDTVGKPRPLLIIFLCQILAVMISAAYIGWIVLRNLKVRKSGAASAADTVMVAARRESSFGA